MQTLIISNETRHGDLVRFCGDKLISFTGQTFVKAADDKILLQLGDEIVKHDDGNFTVNKHKEG